MEGTFAPQIPTLLDILGLIGHFFSLPQIVRNNTSRFLLIWVSSLGAAALRLKLGALLRTLILLEFELSRVLEAALYIFGTRGSF